MDVEVGLQDGICTDDGSPILCYSGRCKQSKGLVRFIEKGIYELRVNGVMKLMG